MSRRIGLTGGIGSGKSTVAALFREYGVMTIDSDEISHQLTQPGGTAIADIRATFGDEYIGSDGALNRPKMRQLIFTDPVAKQRLETILHPLIRRQMLAQADTPGTSPYVLLVIPLLFEAQNYRELVQHTLVVDCTEENQLARAIQRSGLDKQEVRAIMAQQVTRTERLKLADDIINNDGDVSSLRPQVAQLHQHYLTLFAGSN